MPNTRTQIAFEITGGIHHSFSMPVPEKSALKGI
jgi:hypothetical protein